MKKSPYDQHEHDQERSKTSSTLDADLSLRCSFVSTSSSDNDQEEQEGAEMSMPSSTESSNPTDSTKKRNGYDEVTGMIRKDTVRVNVLRVVLIVTILAAGGLVSSSTFKILDQQFKGDAHDAVRTVAGVVCRANRLPYLLEPY